MKNLEECLKDIQSNADFRAQLAATGDDQEALDKVLADNGYAVTAKDIMEFVQRFKGDKLSKDDLQKVAGGFWVDSPGVSTNVPSGIACCIVGAGATCWMSFGRDEEL